MTVSVTTAINALARFFGSLAFGLHPKAQTQVASIVMLGLVKGYTWENIKRLIQQFNCETGNGTDYKFLEHNNGWGMMEPSWSTYTIGSVGVEGQGIYPNIFAATLDRFKWDKRNGIGGHEIDYMAKVQQAGYNPSSNYPAVVANYEDHGNQALTIALAIPTLIIGTLYIIKNG